MMQLTKVEVSPNTKIRDKVVPRVMLGTANIVVKAMIEAIAQHLERNVPNVEGKTILKWYAKVVQMTNETKAGLGQRKVKKERSSMR